MVVVYLFVFLFGWLVGWSVRWLVGVVGLRACLLLARKFRCLVVRFYDLKARNFARV